MCELHTEALFTCLTDCGRYLRYLENVNIGSTYGT